MSDVKLNNVRKKYDNLEVIHGVDLNISNGEFCVFVGPSGCGKSTLLRMIAGLEEVTEGSIEIAARDVTRIDPADRGIAMVFQSYALYPHMTVAENMGFGLKMTGHSKTEIHSKVHEASKILRLENFLTRKPKALSGGQRQRVAIGRAIVRGPKVFLFDEPLSNLDAELRVEMRIEIARLHKEIGATMIYVTHDQVEAMTLADKIVVLKDGNVEQSGSPMELYKNPDNRFVAGFIGSPSTNFFRAEINNKNLIIPALGDKIVPVNIDANKAKTSLEVGIRPQNLEVHPDANSELYIEFRERLGGVSYDYLKTPTGESLTVETKSDDEIKPGTKVSVGFKESDVLIFDRATGHRVR